MDLLATQIVTLLALVISCLVFSLLPLALERRVVSKLTTSGRATQLLSYANCFAGGVFLGICFLDLLPDVLEALGDELHKLGITTDYPFPQFISGCGFFFVHFVENLMHRCLPHDHDPGDVARQARRQDNDQGGATVPLNRQNSNVTSYSAINRPAGDGNTAPNDRPEDSDNSSFRKNVPTILLLIALSVHGAFEGIAIGVQPTKKSLLNLFSAVIIHKSILAFSLGMNVAGGGLLMKYKVATCIVFAVSCPFGQGIGLAVTNADSGGLATGILQGIALGTLLHVTFMEVLSKELKTTDLLRTLLAVIGYAIIAGLTLMEG